MRAACLLALLWGAAAQAELVELTVLHTTDLHATIGPDRRDAQCGDWLRLATLLRRERAAAGGPERVLLLDTGDTVQGSLVGAVSQGACSPPLLAELGYDAWVLGNHEFEFGVPRLVELVTQHARTPILTGNLQLRGAPPFPGYRVFVRQGARIAVIGMTTAFLDHWLLGPQYEGYTVEPALDAIGRLMPAVLAERPDLIVLAIHQGFVHADTREVNEVRAIAYRFPQIGLILGGHTSLKFAGERVGQSWYVQPAAHAAEFARIRVTIDLARHRVTDLQSTLVPVPEETPVDAAAAALVQPWLERTAAVGGEVLGKTTIAVSGKGTPGVDCGMSDLLCRAMLHASGAQLALHGTLAEESWPTEAVVDGRALYRAVPYENQLCVVHLTPAELREVVAEQLRNRSSYTYAGLWGAHAEVAADGETVSALQLPAGMAADTRLALVLTSYHAAGGGNRYPVLRALVRQPATRLHVLPQTTRDALRAYLLAVPDWCRPPTPWLRLSGAAARRAKTSPSSAQPATPVAGPAPTAPGVP